MSEAETGRRWSLGTAEEPESQGQLRSEVLSGAHSLNNLERSWDDLFSRAVDASPHLCRPWVETFISERRCRGAPLLVLTWCNDKLVALLPIAVRKLAGARIASPIGTGVGSYLGLLLDPCYPGAVESIADSVVRQRVFDTFYNADLYSEDAATGRLFEKLNLRGCSCRRIYRNECPLVNLDCSFDTYLKVHKSRASRQKLLRKERKLLSKPNVRIEHYSGEEVTAEHIKRIALIQHDRWAQKGTADLHQPFYQKLLLRMAEAGMGHLWLLRIDEEDAAFVYSLLAHRRYYHGWTCYSRKYPKSLSVGSVLMTETIRKACQSGALSCEFGQGGGEWKERWANASPIVERIVAGRGLRGRTIANCYYICHRLGRIKWVRSCWRRFRRLRRRLAARTGS
ncbi:MAG: GNAT family N-acetyltransferase [Phycisphaerales bacterium]|nr:MAG: GNAT family N-acetyltransferase [Phycisphaerales bacterium]